jgi:hypothetical protein
MRSAAPVKQKRRLTFIGGSAVFGSLETSNYGVAEERRTRGFVASAFAECALSFSELEKQWL